MSSSLRSRVNKLAYEGHISQADADRIRDALAKQIPKNPIRTNNKLFPYSCPTCGCMYMDDVYYYNCVTCGQKISWSEDDE